MEESTLQGVRGNGWYLPEIGVHDSHESWQEAGKPSVMEEAGDDVRNILETHQPEPLAREVEKELQRILSRAQKVEGSYPLV